MSSQFLPLMAINGPYDRDCRFIAVIYRICATSRVST